MYIPTVSICIPAYKQVDYLRKTLCSIQDQTYTDYEIVITDDSPNDDVKNLVQEFNFENKLKYYKNRKQLGSPRNWNEAVSKSGGKYIKILHHDDWFTFPYSLGEFVALLDNNKEVDFAFSAAVGFNVKEDHKWIHSATEKQLEQLKENPEVLFFEDFP